MKKIKITKKLASKLKKYGTFNKLFYVSDKYFTDGNMFLLKDKVDYSSIETQLLDEEHASNLNKYTTKEFKKILQDRFVNYSDFKYMPSLQFAGGGYNYNADKGYKKGSPAYYIGDGFYKIVKNYKATQYRDSETKIYEATFGIASLYLQEIVEKYNLKIEQIIHTEKQDNFDCLEDVTACYYLLYDENDDVVGGIAGTVSESDVSIPDNFIVLTKIDNLSDLENITVGTHIK